MAGNYTSLGIGGGGIKSTQRGVSASGAVTITAVNTAKTSVRNLGSDTGNSKVILTNSTTVTVSSSAGTISWELTEMY